MLTAITHQGIYRQLGLDISGTDNCYLQPSGSQFRPQAVEISLESVFGGRIYKIHKRSFQLCNTAQFILTGRAKWQPNFPLKTANDNYVATVPF